MKRLLPLLALALASCQASTSISPINSGLLPSPTSTPVIVTAPPPAVASPDPPTRLVAEVIKTDSLLRNGPGAAGQIIDRLQPGTTLTVRHPERGGPWYEVVHESTARSGWMHASLIRFRTSVAASVLTPTPRTTPSPTPAPTQPPVTAEDDEVDEADSADEIKVWVNTNSGVYHCAGSRWYGNTKEGRYVTQSEAEEKGYRPAYGNRCY